MRKFLGCMRQQSLPLLLIGGMITLMVVLLFEWSTLSALDAKISTLIAPRHHPPPPERPMSISQDATNTSGQTATITTVKLDSETIEQWLQRHADAVEAFERS